MYGAAVLGEGLGGLKELLIGRVLEVLLTKPAGSDGGAKLRTWCAPATTIEKFRDHSG